MSILTGYNPFEQDVSDIYNMDTVTFCEDMELNESLIREAEYKGKKVTLMKPFYTPGGPKKSAVYVKDGDKVIIVRFGDPNMEIKKDDPEARASFRARHKCDTANDPTTPRYWSCRAW